MCASAYDNEIWKREEKGADKISKYILLKCDIFWALHFDAFRLNLIVFAFPHIVVAAAATVVTVVIVIVVFYSM